MDSGLSGYTFLSSNMPLPIPLPEMPSEVAGAFGTAILQDVSDPEAMSKLFKPINDTIQEKWPGKVQFIAMIDHYTSFFEWYKENHDAGRGGRNTYVASRLLERDILEEHNHNFTAALKRAFEANTRFDIFMVGGKGVKDAQPRGGENAVNPAWRKATVLASMCQSFLPRRYTRIINITCSDIYRIRPFQRHSGAECHQNIRRFFRADALTLPQIRIILE